MENQIFFCDLYGYEGYADYGQELTDEFLNNGEYICCDDMLESPQGYDNLHKHIKELEENGTLITEMFIKQRVLRDNPIFKHIMNGGKIKIELI